MWAQATSLLLLLFACSFWPAEGQSDGSRRQNIWNEPIKFNTKAKDQCTMIITGQGEYTKLRLSCEGKRSYWCEYVGKPYTCRSYNKNPRHYFIQMMWGLRKLFNACQAPRVIKPHMCRTASDESQMVFSSSSISRAQLDASRAAQRPASRQPVRVQPRVKGTQQTTPRPTPPAVESNPKRIARLYCWRSLQGVCAYVVGLFRS
ncbi:fibroblast growth factor binding protein 2a [Sphaeramia orbicularis]|uniref:fibroblast growth factor binding protein 2a n=1 Tax=Sphaeramia orbicularis TaxID=375764 RepID=UPI00117FAF2B|nr:fibroblast growth factor-binding protein 2-like [Sphaeramia orbicularis]